MDGLNSSWNQCQNGVSTETGGFFVFRGWHCWYISNNIIDKLEKQQFWLISVASFHWFPLHVYPNHWERTPCLLHLQHNTTFIIQSTVSAQFSKDHFGWHFDTLTATATHPSIVRNKIHKMVCIWFKRNGIKTGFCFSANKWFVYHFGTH